VVVLRGRRRGAVALPCNEQLRPKDLVSRIERVAPRVVLAAEHLIDAVAESGFDGPVMVAGDERLYDAPEAPAVDLAATDPGLITFTSGTAGEPKPIRHGQRYLHGQRVQAEHWFGAREGDLCWCTAASGWSKSARNVFIAPWLRGAAALLPLAGLEWLSGARPAWTATAVSGTLYLAVVVTALGYVVWNWALARVPAPRAAIFLNIQPIVGALLGTLLLGEPITPFTVLGGVLVVTGLAVAFGPGAR